jgi:hypothetical protein
LIPIWDHLSFGLRVKVNQSFGLMVKDICDHIRFWLRDHRRISLKVTYLHNGDHGRNGSKYRRSLTFHLLTYLLTYTHLYILIYIQRPKMVKIEINTHLLKTN